MARTDGRGPATVVRFMKLLTVLASRGLARSRSQPHVAAAEARPRAGRRLHGPGRRARPRRRAPPQGGGLHRQRLGERAGHRRCCATRSATTRTRASCSSSATPTAPARPPRPGASGARSPGSAASSPRPATSAASSTRSRPRRGAAALIAEDGRSLVVSGHLSTQDIEDKGGVAAEDAKRRVSSDTLDVAMGGFAPGFNDVNDQTRKDLTNAELIAFPALAILLLLVFRGVIAAAIPLLIGVISILGTFLVLRIMSAFVDTSLFALNITTALSLGLAVDYALLLVSRYREEIAARRRDPRGAAPHGDDRRSHGAVLRLHRRGRDGRARRSCRSASSTRSAPPAPPSAILSALIAVFVVPALLALLGTRIDALSIRRGPAVVRRVRRLVPARARGHAPPGRGRARRARRCCWPPSAPLLSTVADRPERRGRPAGPALVRAATPTSSGTTRATSSRRSRSPSRGDASRAQLAQLRPTDRRRSTGSSAARRSRAPREGVAYANFALDGPRARRRPPRTPSRGSARSRRRARPRSWSPATPPASSTRRRACVDARRRSWSAFVAATTLVLLFMLTGSVLLPIKALLMNALTLAATLGIVVLAFQEGWLDGLFDYTGPGRRRGDQPRLPVRGDLRPRHRLRGAGDGAHQGAARPRASPTRRRSRSASAAPAA